MGRVFSGLAYIMSFITVVSCDRDLEQWERRNSFIWPSGDTDGYLSY